MKLFGGSGGMITRQVQLAGGAAISIGPASFLFCAGVARPNQGLAPA
jgi:hypothetical protein